MTDKAHSTFLLTKPIAGAAKTRASAVACVYVIVGMSMGAMSLDGHILSAPSALDILSIGDRLAVPRIDTGPVFTEMVKLKPLRNWSDEILVRNAMGQIVSPIYFQSAVSPYSASLPYPAPRERIYNTPRDEAVNQCTAVSTVMITGILFTQCGHMARIVCDPPACTASPAPDFSPIYVCFTVLVPMRAMGLDAFMLTGATQLAVLTMGPGLKVIWIAASAMQAIGSAAACPVAVMALMVKVETPRYRTNNEFVHDSVNGLISSADADHAVPLNIAIPEPEPAAGSGFFVNPRNQSLKQRGRFILFGSHVIPPRIASVKAAAVLNAPHGLTPSITPIASTISTQKQRKIS